ncbi:MAG: hypothetical protein ACRDZX_14765 [Acidimicrobiales bacterium]
MPIAEPIAIDVSDLTLLQPGGNALALGALGGVQVLVLLRHRH